jgi:hypothetical protein
MLEGVLREAMEPLRPGPVDLDWQLAELLAIGEEPPHPADAAITALEEAQRAFRAAEARRVDALLLAYEAGMEDLSERFGSQYGGRSGLGASAFLKQAAVILQMGERAAAHLLDTAYEARLSMPKTWTLFLEGRATWRSVDTAVRQSEGLADARMPDYDEVAAHAVEHTAAPRLKDRLRRAAERLQKDTAAERRRTAEQNRRVELEPLSDGEAALIIRGPAPELVAFHDAVTKAAIAAHGNEGEERPLGALRFDITLDLLLEGIKAAADPANRAARVPQRKGVVPTLYLTVPALAWLGHTNEQAGVAGYGPIDMEQARELAAKAPGLIRILTDPVTGVRLRMDRTTYSPPPDLRRWVGVRHETCGGLGCRRPWNLCDIDHAQEWHDSGGTNDDNLVPLCRPCHLVKSTGLWTYELAGNGTVTWTSPWGRSYSREPADQCEPVPHHLLPTLDRNDPPF